MTEFTERAPIEQGFSKVYAARIAPELDRLEAQRQELHEKGLRHLKIGIGAGVVFGLLLWIVIDDPVGGLIGGAFGLLFGTIGGFAARQSQAQEWSGTVAEKLMPVLCEFIGDLRYRRSGAGAFEVEQFRTLGLVGSYNRAKLEDMLDGRYRDTGFQLVEAHLHMKTRKRRRASKSSGSSTTEVFKGLMFRIDLPSPAPTRILIMRNYGKALNLLAGVFSRGAARDMPRVDTGHTAFEAAFELHAEAPDRVPDYLPHAFLDNLVAIAQSDSDGGAKGMRAAFDDGHFYLILTRRRPFMEMTGLSKPVHGIEDELHKVFDDIALIHRIIDRLRGDTPAV